MPITIEMPKLSDTMSEGRILSWKKREGDQVEAGEILAEIESDKANMEMEAYDAGWVRKLLVKEGDSAPVGAPIAIITETPDEDIEGVATTSSAAAATAPAAAGKAAPPSEPSATSGAAPVRPAAAPSDEGRKVLASPLAFRMAAERGLDLSRIRGTGPAGRVVKRDIEKALRGEAPRVTASGPSPGAGTFASTPAEAGPDHEDTPVSSMRKVIASRLTQSKVTAPHFYATVEIDMAAASAAREALNAQAGTTISFNDLVVKAVAVAIVRNPGINASWMGETIRQHRSVDIGIAVSIPDGLIVPVVRACHAKGLRRLSEEIRSLAERARDRKLLPEEYQGGTFTVSNLGMYGISHFTGIINPPEACLLAVGAVRSVPVVKDGAVVPGTRMSVTLSCDHRVVDGALAAKFLKDLRETLENPLALAL